MEASPNTDLALAIEHMKTHQLTLLNARTDCQREGYALISFKALEFSKELLQALYDLEHGVLLAKSLSDTHDLITEVRLKHARNLEALDREFDVVCNGEPADKDPRKVPLRPGVFLKQS
ncbi:hypothetical protein CGY83_17105 [Salmonella enterica subsp. enterica serovar Enteritidis]|nr:hypothetical protein [Salmonella enterica subsp. enterica serovar Enteritidis]EDE1429345.1 hypothetical protein [Salmonella enterica subsp. enterica serovar Enteritidis]EDJ3473802.1 hypothetical protein [Salmonella enterica subsp. enterica serovar Enteritidis]